MDFSPSTKIQETASLRERKLKDQIIIEARRHVILDADEEKPECFTWKDKQ